ncbi:DUF2341 domain-containing protein [Erythrobacter sp. Alg231-14]|uniref:DUF2341 domain-containing protein n=1 Tax=Erythrobacter sp. Alg231-14 TaxID=1922225 RepID=UPI000D5553C7
MKLPCTFMIWLAFLLVGGAVAGTPSAAQSRLSCEWSHSIAVTATAGVSAHSDEIRVDLTGADLPAGYSMSSDGADLRVFADDNTTPIPFFISRWDALAQQATVFIRPPGLAAGSSATFNFFLGNAFIGSASDATGVFPNTGIRVFSRVSAADPSNGEDGLSALQQSGTIVADVIRSDVFRINNRTLGGSNGDYGLCVSTLINVAPSQEGTWSFRGGFDFGRGGHFRLNEALVGGDWNDDIWWATNFNNPDVFEGTRMLDAGWHRIEALGFEGCCDGPIEIQARPPGGNYSDLRTSNFPLRAAICTNIRVTTSTTQEACPIGLDVNKASVTFEDTRGGNFALPGTIVTYEIAVANTGQRVDDTTIDILDTLPADARLVVVGTDAFELVQGSPASGVALDWVGHLDDDDGVEFSTDGSDFGYEPQPGDDGTDSAITHVRFSPDGSLNPADNTDQPSFVIRLKLIIE